MTLNYIEQRTDTIVALEARHWAWARFLGAARTSSNDRKRARRSDRGEFNTQVDLLGALGELFLLRRALEANSDHAVAYMRRHLYHEQGGGEVEGPDIEFVDDDTRELRQLDVKTFDCSPNKRFFAINDNKHHLLQGHCSHYLCVITPSFGRRMAVSSLVPWSTVERWSVKSLRHGGSDSRNFPIEEFLRVHFRTPPSLEALRHDVYPRTTIERAWSDSDVREGFTELVPGVPIPETTSRGRRTRRPW